MLTRLATLLLILSATTAASATTIVVFRQPGHIILAADSIVVSPDSPEQGKTCKVRRAGSFFYVLGGQIDFGDGGPDTFAIAERAIAPAATIQEALEALVSKEGPALHDRFKALVRRLPTAKFFLHVAIGGFEHGRPMVGLFLLDLKEREPFALNVRKLATRLDDEPLYYTASVDWDAHATRLMKIPRPAWVQRGDAVAARRLIAEQIVATPTQVRAPIDVLNIRSAGARWVNRSPASACAPL